MAGKLHPTEFGFGLANRPPETREEYLSYLRSLGRITDWTFIRIGVLECELHLGRFPSGHPRAQRRGLQVQHESDTALLRRKCIGTMRAWVVRHIPKGNSIGAIVGTMADVARDLKKPA